MEFLWNIRLLEERLDFSIFQLVAHLYSTTSKWIVCCYEFFFRLQNICNSKWQIIGFERHTDTKLQVDKVQSWRSLFDSELKITHLHLWLNLLLNSQCNLSIIQLFSLSNYVQDITISHDDTRIIATCVNGYVYCFSLYDSIHNK